VHNVLDMTLEDRMESFFLSETCKYLYLLFDTDHYVNKHFRDFVFSTEGHLFRIRPEFRQLPWSDYWTNFYDDGFRSLVADPFRANSSFSTVSFRRLNQRHTI
jgi:hypothetical protein